MASDSRSYSAFVPSDLADEVDEKRDKLGNEEPLNKSEAVERGLELWAGQPTWRESTMNSATNLALLAVVAFISGYVSTALTIREGGMLAWILLAVASAITAILKLEGKVRDRNLVRKLFSRRSEA